MAKELETREDWIKDAAQNAYNYDWSKVPHEFVDDDFVSRVIYAHPAAIKDIPAKYLSQASVNFYAKNDSDANHIATLIPDNFRNKETWANFFALHHKKSNLPLIPEKFRDKEFFSMAVNINAGCVKNIPEEFQTQDMWVQYARVEKTPKDVPSIFKDESFYIQIATYVPMKFIPEMYQSPGMWGGALRSGMYHDERTIPLRMREEVSKHDRIGSEDEWRKAQEAVWEVGDNSNKIFDVPYENQSQDLWNRYARNNPNKINSVPKEFQTQEMWETYAGEVPDAIDRIPKEFRSCEIYEKYIRRYPDRIMDIPEEYQTLSMWRRSGKSLLKSPESIRTQEFWDEIIRENPDEFMNMPNSFKSPAICKTLIVKNGLDIKYIPTSVMNTDILETYIYMNPDKVQSCVTDPQLQPFLTQKIYDRYARSVNYDYSEISYRVPDQFQTYDMWQRVLVNNFSDRKNIIMYSMPEKLQTQEMWNSLAESEQLKPEEIKEVPSQFKDGVEKILNKLKSKNDLINQIEKAEAEKEAVFNLVETSKDDSEKFKLFERLINVGIALSDIRLKVIAHIGLLDEKKYKDASAVVDKIAIKIQEIKEKAQEHAKENETAAEPVDKKEPAVAGEPTDVVKEPVSPEDPTVVANEDGTKVDEGFENIMKKFAQVHADYYDGKKGTRGNAHTKEEVALKNKINKAMKKYLQNQMGKVATENNLNQDALIEQLSNAVSPDLISQLVDNKGATLKLMEIMASGVYIRNGERIRLSQKQRIALADTMAKVSEQMLQKETQNKAKSANTKQVVDELSNESGRGE